MNKTLALSLTLFLITLPSGCSKDDTTTVAEDGTITITVSATATAIRDSSGNISVRDATKDEEDSITAQHNELRKIDNKYPVPKPSQNMDSFAVKEITENGIFILENDLKIKMDGITCSASGAEILNRFIDKDSEKLSFHEERKLPDGVIEAYVWVVDETIQSYAFLNDAVILSKWCDIDFENPSKYHQRYVALSKLSN